MDKQAKKTFALYDAGGDLTKNWFVAYYHKGKRIRKYGTINRQQTEEGRREAAAELLAELEQAYVPPPPNSVQKKTLYDALEAYRKNVRKSTYETYRWKLNHLFEFLDGREVNRQSMAEYFDNAANTHHTSTVHNSRRMFNKLLALAGMEHLLEGITVRKGKSKPLRYFQPHQARQLVRHLEVADPQLLLFCKFVYYCFIRPRSELRFLRVSDVFFEERKILMRASFFRHQPGQAQPAGSKNGKEQYIRIPDAFLPDLLPLQDLPPDSFVFPGRGGRPMGKNTMGNKFRKVLDGLGYGPAYQVYSWKHTGAIACVKAGIGLKELQLQLRHHSLDQVNDYLRGLGVMDFDNLGKSFPAI